MLAKGRQNKLSAKSDEMDHEFIEISAKVEGHAVIEILQDFRPLQKFQ